QGCWCPIVPDYPRDMHRAVATSRVPRVEHDPRLLLTIEHNILSTRSDRGAALIIGAQEWCAAGLGVRAKDMLSHSVADRVIWPSMVIGRVKQVVRIAVLPERRPFNQVALPHLILFDQLGWLSHERKAVGRELLDVEPRILATAVAIVLPQNVGSAIVIDEGAGVDRTALFGLADQCLRIVGGEWPLRCGTGRHADALFVARFIATSKVHHVLI